MLTENELVKLYHALDSCSQGNCNNCPRYSTLKSSDTYLCKKQLLLDCKNYIDEQLDKI